MSEDPARVPVIVGVGQVNDRPANPEDGLDPIGLMAEALRRADGDAGGGWLARCDSLAVVSQIAWPHLNPLDGALAAALGMAPAHSEQTAKPNGDSPTRLLQAAANRIGRGEAQVCAVVGAEALRTAARRAASASAEGEARPGDALRDAAHRRRLGYAQAYGLTVPADVYPLYENACRAAWGLTLGEGQAESGALWAGMARVAAATEAAWLHDAPGAAAIVTPNEGNRAIAFPYTKLQVANASVNQGAGFVVTSEAAALARGLSPDRLVYLGHGAGASEDEDVLARASYAFSPSLSVTLEQVLARNAVTADDLACVELYSCFPCVPKLARRALGWPLDRAITVFGGLTFGGGPIGNYMSHAVAEMAMRLRGTSDKGLLFANGGYATHNHAILLSGAPTGARFPQDPDVQQLADARRGPVPPLDPDWRGPAVIETYTVHYDRTGAVRSGVIVARTTHGARTLAHVPPGDAATLALLTSGTREPVGMAGAIAQGPDGRGWWVGVA